MEDTKISLKTLELWSKELDIQQEFVLFNIWKQKIKNKGISFIRFKKALKTNKK